MWTLIVLILVVAVTAVIVRLRTLQERLARLAPLSDRVRVLERHTNTATIDTPLGDAFEELQDRVATLERDIGTWTQESPLSESVDGLSDRVDALKESTETWIEDRAIAETLVVLQERVDALEKSIHGRLEAIEIGTAALVHQTVRDRDDGEPAIRSQRAFARLVQRVTPPSLRYVYELSVDLGDAFWTDTLALSPEELAVARQGTLLRSVTIEAWRSHFVIESFATPLSPDGASSSTRVQRLYRSALDGYSDYSVVWQLALGAWVGWSAPMLVLRMENLSDEPCRLRLFVIDGRFGRSPVLHRPDPQDENVLLNLSLDPNTLASFRRRNDPDSVEPWNRYEARPELTCYEGGDGAEGLRWELWIHDLAAVGENA